MTEDTQPATQPAEQKPQPQLQIRGQLMRSLEFRNPGALTQLKTTPKVTININVDAGKRDEENFLVGLRIACAAHLEEENREVYAVNLDYAGVFRVTNVEPKVLEPLLLIECPRLLFPFARRIIADTTRDGGYSPLLLDPVDFVALYRRELSKRVEANAANGNGATPAPANA